MIDVALLAGRLVLLALLYLFLYAAITTGVGRVASGRKAAPGAWTLSVLQGPRALQGTVVQVDGPVVIGRSPGADIVVGDDFISGRHARVYPAGDGAVVEDLGSTNGTLLNGSRIASPKKLSTGDTIEVGSVRLKVGRA